MKECFNKKAQIRSLPFITYSQQKCYQIQQDALEFLKGLPDEDDYSIVTIVGKSKTGKSFLMNQLLGDPNMFPVQSSIDNHYNGIRIATNVIEHQKRKIIMLDVDGFGSIQGNDDRDCKMFVMAILLSSVIIYNSSGTIDQQSLNNLSLVIEVGKILQKQLINPSFFPSLFWVLRDFSLKMEDKNGCVITSNQYLQSALEQQKGQSQTAFQKNRIRRIIKTLFTDRKCDTLVIPTEQITMNTQNMTNLRSQFIQDFQRFKTKLLSMTHKKGCKEFCGIKMTRDSFIDAAKIYVQTLNKSVAEGSLPKIQNITFKIRQSQAKGFISKFHNYLDQKKQELLQRIIALKKQKQSNKSQLLQCYQKTFEPIQHFYGTIRKNLHELTGQLNQSELQQAKNSFYETIQRESEIYLHVGECEREQLENSVNSDDEEEMRIANICQYFAHILDENELQKEYFNEIKELRSRHVNKKNMYFSNLLMKLQIAFLRRKVQLNKGRDRRIQQLQLQLKYREKEVDSLTTRNRQLQNQILSQARQNRNKTYITPNKNTSIVDSNQRQPKNLLKPNREFSTYSKINKQNNFTSASKIESLSFYVPYITIQKSSYLQIKIIRTLIKEDSRRNSYIEYVIEVTLLDQKWVLNRKFKDFSQLHSILVMMYQSIRLPECEAITKCVRSLESNPQLRKQIVQVRRKELESYMRELIQIEGIRNSRILQKFLKINKQYTVL